MKASPFRVPQSQHVLQRAEAGPVHHFRRQVVLHVRSLDLRGNRVLPHLQPSRTQVGVARRSQITGTRYLSTANVTAPCTPGAGVCGFAQGRLYIPSWLPFSKTGNQQRKEVLVCGFVKTTPASTQQSSARDTFVTTKQNEAFRQEGSDQDGTQERS